MKVLLEIVADQMQVLYINYKLGTIRTYTICNYNIMIITIYIATFLQTRTSYLSLHFLQ